MGAPIVFRMLRRAGTEVSRRANAACISHALRAAGVSGASAIPTYTRPAELVMLYDLARGCRRGAVALEIGSYLGASTCYLAAGLREAGGMIYCVDTWQNQTMPDGERDTLAEFKRNTAGVSDMLKLIRKPSDELTRDDVPEPLEFIFIDGDHSYEAVKADFALVSPWLADGGLIALHDHAAYSGVARLVGEALISRQWTVAAQIENLLCLKRAVYYG